ncbi:MAG: 2-amino-4-hydroxy-6-hydroxymethyldihydropteridine diphosphokinase [Candidatus Latescibacterota bacterium]|nr:MAG: 2-amino-4-hydroxy-6-hydroxymethyldihydropteridine diphosphokinase [Candidatus Latescibacterota bacterium]RKY72828.1 MAG: 2-amino-4-hydroxy-6-hydroxymethyldihydropteridine diphosphokinase [Candidatus Latescibacterota bacterium]
MAVAYVGLGSNLGDRTKYLREAVRRLKALPGTKLEAVSSFYDTAPVGVEDQPRFLNAVVKLRTELPPKRLLEGLLEIERELGRKRTRRWGPRTVDLDLLLYDDRVISEPGLQVPHPRMHERSFVLVPLAELDPELVHPVLGRTIRELLEGAGRGDVHPIEQEGRCRR